MVCAECMKMCCLGGKNSVVKGLIAWLHAWPVDEAAIINDVDAACLPPGPQDLV